MANSTTESKKTMTSSEEEGWNERFEEGAHIGIGEKIQSTKQPWRKNNIFSWLFLW